MRKELIIFIFALAVATVTSMPHIETDNVPKTHEDTGVGNPTCNCGIYAQCVDGKCICPPGFTGNPYERCSHECFLNWDCPRDQVCFRRVCKNPCVGACGEGAECAVINDVPICSCPTGSTGNALKKCHLGSDSKNSTCNCGLNAKCVDDECVCEDNYIGIPQLRCDKIECQADSECSDTKICKMNKCIDPCINMCGKNAVCSVVNRIVKCDCPENMTGDPFVTCSAISEKIDFPIKSSDPCSPSPCGENALCDSDDGFITCHCPGQLYGDPYEACKHYRPVSVFKPGTTLRDKVCTSSPCGPDSTCNQMGDNVECRCYPGYIGSPPNCKPECTKDSDCGSKSACISKRCANPCFFHSCSSDAVCTVVSHIPICTSKCAVNSDCPANEACINQHCSDPCPGACGKNARCTVLNHTAVCTCLETMTGDPYRGCYAEEINNLVSTVCTPNACGPNSLCQERNGYPLCSCLPGFIDIPPFCQPGCNVDSDCSNDQRCIDKFCTFCSGCGKNARCHFVDGTKKCTCLRGLIGDPYVDCKWV